MLSPGMSYSLKVLRETDIAYLLTDQQDEVFLHKREATHPYAVGEIVEVFIYTDNQGRITASTRVPTIQLEQGAFLEVVGMNPQYGVFLNNNLVKDLLLSKDALPFNLALWPQIGDRLFVTMKLTKGTLFAGFLGRKQIASFFDKPRILESNTQIEAYVQYIIPDGLVAFSLEGHELFIHSNNMRRHYRLGEHVQARIMKLTESHDYAATLIEQKEHMISADAQLILTYLDNHQNQMRFTDKSSPDEIHAAFHMSKAAFKRALGLLYKQGYVELLPEATQKIKS